MLTQCMKSRSPASADSVSMNIVQAIADHKGIDPMELSPPLYEAIDTDALERVVTSIKNGPPTELRITFTYDGYDVRIAGSEIDRIERRDETS